MRFEGPAYWGLFVVAFLAVAVWETWRPGRPLAWPVERRWGCHGLLFAVTAVVQTTVLRLSAVVVAVAVAGSHWGILNRPWLPFAVRSAAAVLLLDLAHYLTHRAFHAVYPLWRIHEVHHSDPDYDVSTGARFHPIETVLTQGAYLAVVAALAPPPVAVFAAELLTILMNFFVHANAALPGWAERALRYVIVTPGLHRIHHSEEVVEQSRNFGQTFSFWDRAFDTYLPAANAGGSMVTGIKGLQNETSLRLWFTLREPFRRRTQPTADPAA
jgi:sterol desaturase/sphingolipid hydroxylase (fatty acid hydroxylase superfamily)